MEEFISQEYIPLNEGISSSTIQDFSNLDLSNEKDKQIAELSKKGYQLTVTEEQNREAIETLTNNMITKIVEINSDLPVEEIEKIIGDKIAVIKSKKEASVAEVSNKLNSKMQSLISKIITFDFR